MFTTIVSFLIAGATMTAPSSQANRVNIDFDKYGIPHIDANTDEGAYYGAGFVAARDRWFQMCVERLRARGRMSESFGRGHQDVFLKSDRRARIIDWAGHADRVVSQMDQPHLDMLQAYCDGVNRWVTASTSQFIDMFETYQIFPTDDLWLPQDCIIVWLNLGDLYTSDGLQEVATDLVYDPNKTDQENLLAIFGATQVIDHAATITQSDVDVNVQTAMDAYAALKGVNQHVRTGAGSYTPQFSDMLVVSASALDTQGSSVESVLWGAPRLAVAVPNVLYEWHMRGASFDVRGAGIPGSPNLLFGSTSHATGEDFAWSVTAASTDVGDLFKLEVVDDGNAYLLNGNARVFAPDRDEIIQIRDIPGDKSMNPTFSTETVKRRGTHWGPLVTELIGPRETTKDYAMSFVPTQTTPALPVIDPMIAFVAMYRANNVTAFWDALGNYTFPSANLAWAASDSTVGYTVVGAVPVRAKNQAWAGLIPMDGTDWNLRWQEYVPPVYQPRVDSPASGYLYNANSLPIGSWYPLLAYYAVTGDGYRSYRLRKLMETSAGSLTVSDVADLFKGRKSSVVRSVTNIALEMRDMQGYHFNLAASDALDRLEPWVNAEDGIDGQSEGAVLAHYMPATFDLVFGDPQSVEDEYGAREHGFLNMLSEIERGLAFPVPRLPHPDEQAAIEAFLACTWQDVKSEYPGLASSSWPQEYVDRFLTSGSDFLVKDNDPWTRSNQLVKHRMLAFRKSPLPTNPLVNLPNALDPSDPALWIPYGPIVSPHAGTLADTPSATFNQFVQLGVIDGAESMIGVGPSEDPNSNFYTSSLARMASGDLKPSPQSNVGLSMIGVNFLNPDYNFSYP